MKQRLQLAAAAWIICGREVGVLGDDAGQEMMLIGESCDAKFLVLRALRDQTPIDLRGDITVSDPLERRVHNLMLGPALKRSGGTSRLD